MGWCSPSNPRCLSSTLILFLTGISLFVAGAHLSHVHIEPQRARTLAHDDLLRTQLLQNFEMALIPSSPPLIAEVDMGGGDRASVTVRATVVQAATVFYDTPSTLDKAERLIAEVAGYGSQLVVFPEALIGGYPRGSNFGVTIGSRSAKGREDFRKYHAAAIDVPGCINAMYTQRQSVQTKLSKQIDQEIYKVLKLKIDQATFKDKDKG